MPPHEGHDHTAPQGPSTAPTGTAATFSADSSFSAVITESNAAQTVTGKINVIDPDDGQACLDIGRTLGYSTASTYYKTGEATQTGSYYGSKTIFTLLSNNQLAVISDGDPYPAKAGYTILTNDLSVEREWPLVPNPLTEQDFEYKFTYRGGNLNSDASYSNFFSTSAMGIHGIFLNGVALYNPSSGNGTVPGTLISGNNTYNLNAVFFEQQYGIDDSAGHPSPEGNVVNGFQGQSHYHDPAFLTSGSWNNETFASSNAYFANDYYTDASANIDYIRHADGHSKIVGFCFDGYPIYGPYGYDGSFNSTSPSVLMTTSYRTRAEEFLGRPYTYTNVVSGDGYSYTISAGAFLDDYEYVAGMGSLDDCNGRFCVTPEYPNGTYAYFCLINEEDEPVFPYIIGKYSRQQRNVTIAGYPVDTHDTGGSVIPTTGTAGVFNVSTLGVSKYVSAPINETVVDASYGSFTIDSSGNWSYTMNGPHDEFVTDVSYNDSIRVYSYDGSANQLITVTMMGTAEAPSGPTYTEGMNLASGSLTVPAGGQIGTVSGGSVNLGSSSLVSELTSGTVSIASGTGNITTASGVYSLQMSSNGKLNIATLNGQSGASITFAGANNSIAVEEGSFNGTISGAGKLQKTSLNTLTLSGNNPGFSGPTEILQGIVEITYSAALGSGPIKLGRGSTIENNYNVALVIDCANAETISNPIVARSNGSNTVTNASTEFVTFTGGLTKNGTTLILDGDFTVDCDIIGSSANSDVVASGDVLVVSGNTFDYNGATTVTTGSVVTLGKNRRDRGNDSWKSFNGLNSLAPMMLKTTTNLDEGVSMPNSDLTINAGATLVLVYTSSPITPSTVKSLTLENGSTMIVDISTNLVAGAYTVLETVDGITIPLSTGSSPPTITVDYTGTNGFTATIAEDSTGMNYVVTITDPNPTTPSSNVCFPAKTPVLTNCGYVNIEDINIALHTIRNKKIVAITKTVAHDKNLVRIAKHALGKNYPEKTTFISQNHKVFCQGQMIKAKHLVNETTVTLVPYKGEALYNVLLAEHEKMQVNNLIVETLHPEHKVAKLYRFLKNVDAAHHGKLIALFNKKDQEHRKSTF